MRGCRYQACRHEPLVVVYEDNVVDRNKKRWRRNNEELPVHLRRPEVVRPSRPLSVDQWNQFAWESSQASLVPCENCGRTFAPDRLEVHQRSCKTPLPGAPRKLALQQVN
uniref:C2HC/C3H-type domain-containing protein n=1 Tax=Timema poppense TaxID=170557 RepID=A0A7R9CZC8_TIMPO|nr:unnamed protein product [Timema poppensis]